MKIGIISDTHDAHRNVVKAAEAFEREKVSYILHAGDIESADTAAMFAGIDGAKFIAVYGNCDTDNAELSEIITSFGGEIHETYEGEIAGRHIFMAHRPNFLQSALESGKYDLIIYGHTHRLDIRKAGRMLVVNPGTIRFWHIGRPYVVIVELDNMTAEPIALA